MRNIAFAAMKAKITRNDKTFSVNFDLPIDLSIPLRHGSENPSCFYLGNPRIEPIRAESFVGSIAEGGSCNCEEIHISPHGHGTHTECVGHISKERIPVSSAFNRYHFLSQIISITPQVLENGDFCILREQIEALLLPEIEALIIRTLPNKTNKLIENYSGKNPCYFAADACALMAEQNVRHLLTDLPSVDREEDGGAMASHRAFWQYPNHTRRDASITEMIFVSDEIKDGVYLLQMQITSIDSDASPSKPVVYKICEY